MRRVPVVKTALLGLVTLGIYTAIWMYRNAEDLHEHRQGGVKHWKLLFWLGFVTATITWTILAILNFRDLNKLRAATGIPPHASGIWAMVLWFFVPYIAAILWAGYWNHSVDVLEGRPVEDLPAAPASARQV